MWTRVGVGFKTKLTDKCFIYTDKSSSALSYEASSHRRRCPMEQNYHCRSAFHLYVHSVDRTHWSLCYLHTFSRAKVRQSLFLDLALSIEIQSDLASKGQGFLLWHPNLDPGQFAVHLVVCSPKAQNKNMLDKVTTAEANTLTSQ